MSLNKANEFLHQHITCVIATVNEDGTPQAATVGFSHNEKFEIFIGTNEKSRKYKNLIERQKVAFVTGFEGKVTVQIEGNVKQVEANQGLIDRHLAKIPMAKRFAEQEGQRWFLITPTWLRLTDFAAEIPVFETKDFS